MNEDFVCKMIEFKLSNKGNEKNNHISYCSNQALGRVKEGTTNNHSWTAGVTAGLSTFGQTWLYVYSSDRKSDKRFKKEKCDLILFASRAHTDVIL